MGAVEMNVLRGAVDPSLHRALLFAEE